MAGLFDYINSINSKQEYLFKDDENHGDYVPFLVTKAFSYFPDTIFVANEINKYQVTDKKRHYDFFYYGIDKGKRFSKWYKPDQDETIALVQEYYNVRYSVAREYAKNLSNEDIERLKTRKGGIQ